MLEKLEIVINVAAGVGLVFAGYVFFRYKEDRNNVLELRAELNRAKLYSPLLKQAGKLDFGAIKKGKSVLEVALVVPAKDIDSIPRNTLIRSYHDLLVSKHESEHISPFRYDFMVGETGGQFGIRFQDCKIKVDLRECNVHRNLMQRSQSRNVDVMGSGSPQYESVSFFLKSGCSMIIVGSLRYSL